MDVNGDSINVQTRGGLAAAELVMQLTFAIIFALFALLLANVDGVLSIPVALAGAVAGWRFSTWLLSLARAARPN